MRDTSNDRSIGGSATGETGVGTLRNEEAGGISTPGDFGSQGATGEGIFGTSGGGQRSTMSGRFGSSSASLRSGPTGTPASPTAGGEDSGFSGSDETNSFSNSGEEESFSCCCGQPMRKSTGRGLSSSRAAGA